MDEKWMVGVGVGLVLLVVVFTCGTASACSLAGNPELVVDPTAEALEPGDFTVEVTTVKRGADTGSSCDDLGWATLYIVGSPTGVGYRVELIDGEAPRNLATHATPVLLDESNSLTVVWSEAVSEEQPPLEFTLGITAVSPDGTEGEMKEVVVRHGGIEVGCSSTGARDTSLLALLLLAGALLLRRRSHG